MGFNKLSHLNSQKSGKEVKRLANFCKQREQEVAAGLPLGSISGGS